MSKENPEFNTAEEILSDPLFLKHFDSNYKSIMTKRKNRHKAKQGYQYKRDWYDRLLSKGNLSPEFFLSNIKDIWHKESSLNRETRDIIEHVCNKSLKSAMAEYEESKE